MRSISGRHSGRQLLIEVAILHPDDRTQYVGSDSPYLKESRTFTALIDTGATST